MKFTDIFIKRPVLSLSVSFLIFILGLAALVSLQVTEYPNMVNTTITVTTDYPGASASVIQGYITHPLENSIASADGIDYMTSSSEQGMSVINVYTKLNFDPDAALTEVTGKVNAVMAYLPKQAQSPSITKQTGNTFPVYIVGFTSKTMSRADISAYLETVVVPTIYTVGNISNVIIMGQQRYAMRVWLDPHRMARMGITPIDVNSALANNSVQAAPGQLKTNNQYLNMDVTTDLHTPEQFNDLVIKQVNGRLVHINDIGNATLGSENYDTDVTLNGDHAVFVAVQLTPEANPIPTVEAIQKVLANLKSGYPAGLKSTVTYDATVYVKSSISDVIKTIIEAVIIVIIIIFLFLGSLRSVLIPVISIPMSLVGVCLLMAALGFSINLLTLLAMVLAIGLVVDDAIVILENIYRHIEEGQTPFNAAIIGAREVAAPILVMATTLVAVFAPIGFMGGITGALFTQFAFTLAACVLISAVVALTLSPMLCSRLIDHHVLNSPVVKLVDRTFNKISNVYQTALKKILQIRYSVLAFGIVILTLCGIFYSAIPQELAPQEDQGIIIVEGKASSWANLGYLEKISQPLTNVMSNVQDNSGYFIGLGLGGTLGVQPNMLKGGIFLKPWDQRKATEMDIVPTVQNQLSNIPGITLVAQEIAPLPGSTPPPIQFVVKSTGSYQELYALGNKIVDAADSSGLFLMANMDLQFDMPDITITVNRNKAGALGIPMSEISETLATMFGGNYINFFGKDGFSYRVIPQVPDNLRQNQQVLDSINIATASGALIPLSTIVSYQMSNQPQTLNRFDQLNSITIIGFPKPNVAMGTALDFLKAQAQPLLPQGASIDYAQESRQFEQTGNSLVTAFFLAIIIIFLVLSMQFESFRDPLIILVSVPMAAFGALLPLYFGAATINIYTQIGFITLIGLISKHGILMVEFANKQQEEHKLSKYDAIVKAASIRLRPILMTASAMVFSVVPLLIATGPGSASRFDIGLVIFMGMLIGTVFTLFIVPTMYSLIGHDRQKVLTERVKVQQ